MKARLAILLLLIACVFAPIDIPSPATAQGTGTWISKAALPTLRRFFASAALNGLLYTVGGVSPSDSLLSTVEVYNPNTDNWSSAVPFPFPIQRASAAAVNGLLYVVGGCTDLACGSVLNTVYVYDPLAKTWSQRAPIPTPRRDGNFLAVVNGILYAVGGGQGPGCSSINSVEAYNPSTGAWTPRSPMLVDQWSAAVVALNGKIYVAGGISCKRPAPGIYNALADAEVFDPATNAWAPVAPMPFAVVGSEGGILNGKLYVVDGATTGGVCAACVLAYDPATNTWSSDTPDPTARFSPWGDVINGSLYVVGGLTFSSTTLATNEAFTLEVPFAAFSAKVDINLPSSSFGVNSSFTLRAGSSIDPLTQNVAFRLGGFSTTIAAGSFRQGPHGKFLFSGFINSVAIGVNLTPLAGGSYAFRIEGVGASNLPTSNPVTVSLTIGRNTGSTSVNADFQ